DRSDGFSPGVPILTVLPGADLTASGVAPITDIGAALNRDAPIVLIDTRTGRRVPCWAGLDATDPDPATRAILIHPAHPLADPTTNGVPLPDLGPASWRPNTPPA